jgi:hypothetical protein
MNPIEFDSFWKRNYSGIPPRGEFLRKAFFKTRWFRIHSFDDGHRGVLAKRQRKQLLKRHNQLINEWLKEGQPYVLLLGCFDSELQGFRGQTFKDALSISTDKNWKDCALQLHKLEEGELYHTFIVEKIWTQGSLDNLLLKVATEELELLLIIRKQKCIIAPYEGGIDVIVRSEQQREFFRNRYKDWLSTHPLGL